MKPAYLFLASFLVTYIATPLVILVAKKCNCMDKPGRRKVHSAKTPRWGGIALFFGILPIVFFTGLDRVSASYIVSAMLMLIIGIIDDRVQLGWAVKFAGMLAATSIIVLGGDVAIRSIGNYGGFVGKLELGSASIPFTYFCIVGLSNAINLIDGLNGLASGISLIGFLFLGIAALLKGDYFVALVSFAFVGSLSAFLRYNFPKAKIFMGDSGSLFLGFSIAVSSILLTQGGNGVAPMFPVLVFLVPIFDALRVMIIRLTKSKNPFHADKTHLHHLIIRKKISPESAVILIWSVSLLLGCISLYLITKISAHFLIVALSGILALSLFADFLVKRRQHGPGSLRERRPSPAAITRAYDPVLWQKRRGSFRSTRPVRVRSASPWLWNGQPRSRPKPVLNEKTMK